MRKTIKIGQTDYQMKSSAYTQFSYKDKTGRKMLQDLQNLSKLQDANEDELIGGIDDLAEILLKMAYVMIEEADSTQVKSYEDFLKSIDNMYENTDWMGEVIELATSPISRGA